MEPLLRREELARPGVRVLNRGGFANPDVLVVPVEGGPPLVVKDYACRSGLVRWLVAPAFVRHELAMLARLEGLPGIPAPRGRIDRLALAMEYVDGIPLRRRSHRSALPRAFFDALEGILDGLALRGVVHGDLRSCQNILSTRATEAPALVDLASAFRLPLPRSLIRIWDRRALGKLRARFESPGEQGAPDAAPPDYEELHLGSFRFSFMDRGRMADSVPALFLHDVGHSTEAFRPILESAAEHSRRAIGIDLPGFGGSSADRRGSSLGRVARQVERLSEALRLSRMDLVGHGWGGLVARTLAARQPSRVRSLLTVDTPHERLDAGFRRRWSEARRDPELLRRRLLRELPPGLSGRQRMALGQVIRSASGHALQQAYAALRVRRPGRGSRAPVWALRGVPMPPQPWLAIRSGSVEAEDAVPAAPGSRMRAGWWVQPLADSRRIWTALEALARATPEVSPRGRSADPAPDGCGVRSAAPAPTGSRGQRS